MMMSPMGGMNPGMMGGMPMSMYSAQRTMYSVTGIPGLDGGYAYPPGSYMTQFMDQINNTMANASMMPPMGGGMGGGMTPPMGPPPQQQDNSSGMMMQMMGMLIGMMLSKALPLIKERIQANQAAASQSNQPSQVAATTESTQSQGIPVTQQQQQY